MPAIFLDTLPAGDTSGNLSGNFVNVKDCAELHVLSLSTPAAGGKRITVTNRAY
jgi:hypothetical protein